jgi:hypothetical protein
VGGARAARGGAAVIEAAVCSSTALAIVFCAALICPITTSIPRIAVTASAESDWIAWIIRRMSPWC